MNLHRSTAKPDWTQLHKRDWNFWQRLAAGSNGILTPGNVMTVFGFLVVLFGLGAILRHHYWWGGVALIIGRLSDIADGWLANSTGTKSPLGELIDAGIDKLGTFLTIITFYAGHVAPWWVLTLLLLPHVLITGITIRVMRHKRRLHPSRAGKLSMAAVWCCLIGFVILQDLQSDFLRIILALLVIISVALGLYAAAGYVTNHD